jgi:hypothetical protein
MSAPRYRLAIEGELGPRYASAFDGITLPSHDRGWDPGGQGSHSRAWAARRCSQPSRYPGSGDDGVTDHWKLMRESLKNRPLMPTCLEASS